MNIEPNATSAGKKRGAPSPGPLDGTGPGGEQSNSYTVTIVLDSNTATVQFHVKIRAKSLLQQLLLPVKSVSEFHLGGTNDEMNLIIFF
jgi:hypothetical protein